MSDRVDRKGTIAVAIAFVVSGLTSYVTLVVTKRSLDAEDFGLFSLFWSLGFFAAAVSSVPVEQELARSAAVQLERNRTPWREICVAARAAAISTTVTVATCVAVLLTGLVESGIGIGIGAAFAALVAGEAIAAVSRAEMAARRDTLGLVGIVGGHGIVRAGAAVIAALATESLAAACAAVAVAGLVPIAFVPRIIRRRGEPPDVAPDTLGSVGHVEFSHSGMRRLLLATPPRALFAIGTPVLAAVVAGSGETAQVGDVLAALSLTSAPVLVAAALQVTLLPQFASWVERGERDLIRSRMLAAIAAVVAGGAVATLMTALVGVHFLEILFGATPGVGAPALSLMTAGAGLLFLANLLVPVAIAVREYSIVTTAWLCGAIALVAMAILSDEVAFGIGRAVFAGAAVVNSVLLWGLRQVWMPHQPSKPVPILAPRVDTGE